MCLLLAPTVRALGAALADVFLDHLVPLALRFEDVFDGIAEGAVTTGMVGDEVGLVFHVLASVGHGNSKPAMAHDGQIDDVIAHVSSFFRLKTLLGQNFFENGTFVLDALVNVLEFQITRPESHGLRDSLGDESHLYAGKSSQRNGGTVVGVEAFGFDITLAGKAEPALSAMFGSVFLS